MSWQFFNEHCKDFPELNSFVIWKFYTLTNIFLFLHSQHPAFASVIPFSKYDFFYITGRNCMRGSCSISLCVTDLFQNNLLDIYITENDETAFLFHLAYFPCRWNDAAREMRVLASLLVWAHEKSSFYWQYAKLHVLCKSPVS